MPKRQAKRGVKNPATSSVSNAVAGPEGPPLEKKEDGFREEVARQTAAIRALRDMEVEQLLTWLRLFRSYFNKEQLQTPVLQFFTENLPNLQVVSNEKDGQYEVQLKDKDGNISMNMTDGSTHASLLHQMSTIYPNCINPMSSFGGLGFPNNVVKASLFPSDNLQVLEESSDTHMLGLQEALQTPGVSSQRLSVGMTPKTLRLPKPGEMLLSVHGSPLGVYKEDNMEAIHESEEG